MRKTNSELHPECWDFFINFARNIEEESDINHFGKYRISSPDMSGRFIYDNCPRSLFNKLRVEFYKPNLESYSVYGKIQYIVDKF